MSIIEMRTFEQCRYDDENTINNSGDSFNVLCLYDPLDNTILLKMVSIPVEHKSENFDKALFGLIEKIKVFCDNPLDLNKNQEYIVNQLKNLDSDSIAKKLNVVQYFENNSSDCFLPQENAVKAFNIKDFLKENILSFILIICALLVIIFSPKNLEGIGYISVLMTAALFFIMSITILISSLSYNFSYPFQYVKFKDSALLFYITKKNAIYKFNTSPLSRCVYVIKSPEKIKYRKKSITVFADIDIVYLDSKFNIISNNNTSKLKLPRNFENQSVLDLKLQNFFMEIMNENNRI